MTTLFNSSLVIAHCYGLNIGANTYCGLFDRRIVVDSSVGLLRNLILRLAIGLLCYGMLSTYDFTVPALHAVQAEEIQWFDVTTAGAFTSLCGGSFKGHGC
jgi:hypothetical protein